MKNAIVFVTLPLLLFCGCNKYTKKYVWSTIEYNPELPKDPSFEYMEKTIYKNPFSIDATTHKQTCNMYYTVINEKMKKTYAKQANDYDCSALQRKDTLLIDMSFNTGFTCDGLTITIIKNKYSIRPFRVYDNRIEGEKIYYPEIKSQDLVLNKPAYLKDEYIYGAFYLHTKDRFGIVNYWSGEFKCKIKTDK